MSSDHSEQREYKVWYNIQKIINIISYVNRIKEKNHLISIDAGQVPHPKSTPIHEKFLNLMKSVYKNIQLKLYLMVKDKMFFPLRSETRYSF